MIFRYSVFLLQVSSAPMEQILQRLQAFGEFEVSVYVQFCFIIFDLDLTCALFSKLV
jgi:hypothetical protein